MQAMAKFRQPMERGVFAWNGAPSEKAPWSDLDWSSIKEPTNHWLLSTRTREGLSTPREKESGPPGGSLGSLEPVVSRDFPSEFLSPLCVVVLW